MKKGKAKAATAAKEKAPQPRALIDSVVIRFPLSSSARGLCVRAKNGVAFWQFGAKYRHWYASFELSRFTAEGVYTPPVKGANAIRAE